MLKLEKQLLQSNDLEIRICICGETEAVTYDKTYVILFVLRHIKNFSKIAFNKLKSANFILVTGASRFNTSQSFTTTINWDTYWFYKVNRVAPDLIPKFYDYEHHFICMNGRIRNHRMMLIDSLYKEELFKYARISWLNFSEKQEIQYEFKYWSPETLYIDINEELIDGANGNFITLMQSPTKHAKLGMQYTPPNEYYKSFMQVVTETDIHTHFITEKTVIPLILQKPFLALATPDFHGTLTKYGFKLYEEIFDYKFDSEKSLEKRIEGIVKNLKTITSWSFTECKKSYDKILDKLIYNRELAVSIARNSLLVPNVYLENKDQLPKIILS